MPFIDLTLIGLPTTRSRPRVTDGEASKLYKLWSDSPPGQPISAKRSDVRHLVSKGLLKSRGGGLQSKFALTPDGREVIIDMVTNEPNKFAVGAEMPSYKEIKQRAKRVPQTFIKRAMKLVEAGFFGSNAPRKLTPELIQKRLSDLKKEDPAAAQAASSLLADVGDSNAFNDLLRELLQCLGDKKEMARFQEPQVSQQEPEMAPMTASRNVIVRVAGFGS